jgi:hypothetical protein
VSPLRGVPLFLLPPSNIHYYYQEDIKKMINTKKFSVIIIHRYSKWNTRHSLVLIKVRIVSLMMMNARSLTSLPFFYSRFDTKLAFNLSGLLIDGGRPTGVCPKVDVIELCKWKRKGLSVETMERPGPESIERDWGRLFRHGPHKS